MSDPGEPRHECTVFAPATVANVGPGFDCFGLAVTGAGDTIRARLCDENGVRLVSVEGDPSIPTATIKNVAAISAAALWDRLGEQVARACGARGLELHLAKGVRACSGLGSSAASAVAGAVAVEALARAVGVAPSPEDVLDAALCGEAAASGDRHADNVAPALYGGFTIVRGLTPSRITRLTPGSECWIAAVTPPLVVPTRAAREALPELVPLRDAVANWASAASLVAGILTGDEELMRQSFEDRIVEPVRAPLIRGCDEVRQSARDAGAIGAGISGSGPTIFGLATTEAVATNVATAMVDAFAAHGLDATTLVGRVDEQGARVL